MVLKVEERRAATAALRLLGVSRGTLVGWVNEVRRARATLGDDEAVVERFARAPDLSAVEAYGERKASDEARLNANGALAYLDAAADADG